jgi:hypothetical protein
LGAGHARDGPAGGAYAFGALDACTNGEMTGGCVMRGACWVSL